jgi:hypothetical protein
MVGGLFTHSVTARAPSAMSNSQQSGSTLEPSTRRCCTIAPAIEKVGPKSYSLGRRIQGCLRENDRRVQGQLAPDSRDIGTGNQEPVQPFVEASVDRLIVPYVPVTELVIDDAHSFVEAWGKSWSAFINESKTFETEH